MTFAGGNRGQRVANVKSAPLGAGYENLTLELKGDGKGHFMVNVAAWAGDGMDTRLSYTFTIDQTQLPAAIDSLAKFVPL